MNEMTEIYVSRNERGVAILHPHKEQGGDVPANRTGGKDVKSLSQTFQ